MAKSEANVARPNDPIFKSTVIAETFTARCVWNFWWGGRADRKRLEEEKAEVLRTNEWRGLPMLDEFWAIPKYHEESRRGLYAMYPNDHDSVRCGDDLVRWALHGPPQVWDATMKLAEHDDVIGEAMRIVISDLNGCDGIRGYLASAGRLLPNGGEKISCGCGEICKETGRPKAGPTNDSD